MLRSKGARVLGLDNYFHAQKSAPRRFEVENGDIRFEELLAMRMRDKDAVFHLAAAINVDFSHVLPAPAFDINVTGTLNVLECARKFDVKVVFASSSEVYGTQQDTKCADGTAHGYRAIAEDHPLDGQSPYAASKIAADRMCKAWADTYGMKVSIVRLFNTFGPWQADDGYGGVIAKFVRQDLAGEAMTIYGTGEQRRDYVWVDDSVDAFVLALQRDLPDPTNFGTGTTVSIRDLADFIGEEVGQPWRFTIEPPRTGEVDCLRCDWSKAKGLGWEPKTDFSTGLSRYVRWAKETIR